MRQPGRTLRATGKKSPTWTFLRHMTNGGSVRNAASLCNSSGFAPLTIAANMHAYSTSSHRKSPTCLIDTAPSRCAVRKGCTSAREVVVGAGAAVCSGADPRESGRPDGEKMPGPGQRPTRGTRQSPEGQAYSGGPLVCWSERGIPCTYLVNNQGSACITRACSRR